MKGRFIGAVIVALLVASGVPVGAQWYGGGGGCARCGVYSYLDIPAEGVTVPVDGLYLAGWGFECDSGRKLTRIDFWYQTDAGYFLPALADGDVYPLYGVYRPDVWSAYYQHCPRVSGNTGWHLYIRPGLVPEGRRYVAVVLWYRNTYTETHFRVVTVGHPTQTQPIQTWGWAY